MKLLERLAMTFPLAVLACGAPAPTSDTRLDSQASPPAREGDAGVAAPERPREDASSVRHDDAARSGEGGQAPPASASDASDVESSTDAPAATHKIKWNPGHWMLSYAQLMRGKTVSILQPELAVLAQSDGIVGYKTFVTWGYLEPQEGQYDWSDLDALIGPGGQLSQMTPPRHLIIQLNPNVFTGGGKVPGSGDARYLPMYILDDPGTYGPGLLGNGTSSNPNGYGGFWSQQTGGYAANFVNANVQARLVALLQAIGARYDSNPLFEGVILCATDAMYPNAGSGISTSEYIDALETILAATVAALPTSNVGIQNGWAGEVTLSQNLEQWMLEHRVMPASSDTAGATAWTAANDDFAPSNLAWGIQAWLGVQASGSSWTPPSPSLQSMGHSMMDIQGDDISVPSGAYSKWGPYTPLDITNACNTQYGCSHAFWTYMTASDDYPGFTVPPASQWASLLAVVQANPLTNTSYPAVYP